MKKARAALRDSVHAVGSRDPVSGMCSGSAKGDAGISVQEVRQNGLHGIAQHQARNHEVERNPSPDGDEVKQNPPGQEALYCPLVTRDTGGLARTFSSLAGREMCACFQPLLP